MIGCTIWSDLNYQASHGSDRRTEYLQLCISVCVYALYCTVQDLRWVCLLGPDHLYITKLAH
jgi:hypothetical protein